MSAKAGKRPLRSLTAHEKLDAIRRVHDGESKASVARDIGVPESTLRGWCKNEDKISYLSRQSSPETDESLEHKDKRIKLDDSIMQPFNLSLKPPGASATFSPNSDYGKSDLDMSKNSNLSAKAETPKAPHMSEREKNRAELARLSVELGLNRPEMFLPAMNNPSSSLTDLANMGLLAQWNNLLMQQQKNLMNKKVTAPADTSTNIMGANTGGLLKTVDSPDKNKPQMKLPEKQQSVQESVWYWLKTQQAMLGLNQNQASLPCSNGNGISSTSSAPITSMANSTSPLNGVSADQSSWFWKWYKQLAYGQQMPGSMPDKPILYQQLTRDKDFQNAENLSVVVDDNKANKTASSNNNNKARSVLDNLLFNNNNNVAVNKKGEELSQNEAVEHGEKFLNWLETCSDPSVTAMQIMQFRGLLNNIKSGADRKNGDLQNKAKVKRK
ncbi:unnamed protein product [Brassicogethes aeneus]|uniref:HTH psq-type domain-containing protein n=1 Tax=Brassicogethes aeneus TaxID=1431903 RepID=A0A9P0B155_BRAAE|nr:unnamed protein product [Brassicogethes aeneus]